MISRKSTKLIADAYGKHFNSGLLYGEFLDQYWSDDDLKSDTIHNFFYEEEYEPWFIQNMKQFASTLQLSQLLNAIMGLHTGDTQVSATTGWEWSQRRELGQRVLKKLAEDILKLYDRIPEREVDFSKAETKEQLNLLKSLKTIDRPAGEIINTLKAQLEIDGYVYRDSHLYPIEHAVIDVVEERTFLELLIDSVPLKDRVTIKHFIQKSEKAFADNEWGHSISDARNVIEAVLQQVANAYYLKNKGTDLAANIYSKPVKIREFLEAEGLIDKPEQDAIAKIYGLMSNTGSHPNIAEKDQARLLRHLALTLAQFILLKFQGYIKNNP